jgi:hypothetical protein
MTEEFNACVVGCAENLKGGVYRMWNPKTRKVHITRDVIFFL